jgi:exonuclease III
LFFYSKNGRKLTFAHINVTGCDILNNHILDVLMIQETKLCDALPIAQFSIDGYKIYRNDYTEHAERLMVYVVDDLSERWQDDLNGYVCVSGRISYIVT